MRVSFGTLKVNAISLLLAVALLVAATATVLAIRGGLQEQPANLAASQEAEPEDAAEDALTHAADRLTANEVAFDEAVLSDLATRYGVGGAVRVLAWADETGMGVDEITALRDGDGTEDSAMGWGAIARELGVQPGIGSIMGGGHGRDDAPGQTKVQDDDEAAGSED